MLTKIPARSTLSDEQFFSVEGPDGLLTSFQYDDQLHALYFKESQVLIPSHHGTTHVAEDPVPNATTDTPGLMSADDKAKLDSLLQMRLGILGFQGAGFPDDGGWMTGDIILAAGTDFISLERFGNVIRFTVDSPIPLNCGCFLAGARVLMADGTTKAIEDIQVGDLVITHTGSIKGVKNIFRRHYSGGISNWQVDKHSGENFYITDEHPVYSMAKEAAVYASGKRRKNVKNKPSWRKAGTINIGDYISRRRSHNIVDDIDYIDVLSVLGDGFVEENGLVYACRTDETRKGQIDGMANGLPRYIPVNDDLLDLLGYYAAEGCADKKNGVRFSVHTKELEFGDIGAEIHRILATLFGFEPKINGRATPNGRDIQVFCVPLVELFRKWFGGIKTDKRFPNWVVSLPAAKQARIIAALIRGDGYITHTTKNVQFKLELSARALIDQSLFMAERCGWEPANPAPRSAGKKGKSPRYRMTISASGAHDLAVLLGVTYQPKKLSRELTTTNRVMHRITEWSRTQHDGIVYNFEVEDDNSYIVDGLEVHNCEECQQIFWVQDESDVASIRPPTCGGKLPGVNSYGELKIYLLPEATIADPSNVKATLDTKGTFPSLIFKRYDDAIVPGSAEYELTLKRDDNNESVTEIGWAFTPGVNAIPECVWFMGKDQDGGLVRFDLETETQPGLLGALLFNGHLITKKMAVITDYSSTVLSTNVYTCRMWDVDGGRAVGDSFSATNVWQYSNPENPLSGSNPRTLVRDNTIDVLPIGTLVDLWSFQIGEVAGEALKRHYFSKRPSLNAANLWAWHGAVQFGDTVMAREEVQADDGSEDKTSVVQVSAIRNFERYQWGLTGYDDPLLSYDVALTAGTDGADLSVQHRAVIDTAIPALRVISDSNAVEPFSERPVVLWNRRLVKNSLMRLDIGQPSSSAFTPFDIILRGNIDEHDVKYVRVVGVGTYNGLYYIRVKGVHFHDLPPFGSLRVLHPSSNKNIVYNYSRKFVFPSNVDADTNSVDDYDSIVLTGDASSNVQYLGEVGDVLELLHQEYSAPIVRAEFSYNESTNLIELQFKVGTLDMSLPYENEDEDDDIDDYVRGLADGYTVSAVYSQAGTFSGVGTQPDASPDGFVIYDGGAVDGGDLDEYWNKLEIMVRDGQVWVWWNELLIPPNTVLSSSLPSPVEVNTPYYPIDTDVDYPYGKVGVRMWPGATIRRMDVRTQLSSFSEFAYGQLELT